MFRKRENGVYGGKDEIYRHADRASGTSYYQKKIIIRDDLNATEGQTARRRAHIAATY